MNTRLTTNQLTFENQVGHKPKLIRVKKPLIGNKVYLIKERGLFVLEEGACSIRGMACTHAGSGGIVVYDGVPRTDGHFEAPPEELFKVDLYETEEQRAQALKDWEDNRDGREIYYAHPAVMGMWMLDGGCNHGLTIMSSGEHSATPPVLTITWQKFEEKTPMNQKALVVPQWQLTIAAMWQLLLLIASAAGVPKEKLKNFDPSQPQNPTKPE